MKTPDEIAREIIINITVHFVDFDIASINETALANDIAAALTAEREHAEATIDALGAKVSSLCQKESCSCSVDQPSDLCMYHSPKLVEAEDRAEKAEAENARLQTAWEAAEIRADTARTEALRAAAAPYGQNPTALFAGASVEATLLRLIGKDAPDRRAEALREAAEHFKRLAVLRRMWTADQVAAAILALLDKEKAAPAG